MIAPFRLVPSQKTTELLQAFVAAPLVLSAIVWWFGPVEVITFVITALVVILIIGFLLQIFVWFATGGR